MQVNILTDPDVGGNFINWSLYYLTGHTEFFNLTTKQFEPLVDNPLNQYNSHAHPGNFPRHRRFILELPKSPADRLDVVYIHHLGSQYTNEQIQESFDHLLGMTDKNIISTNNTVSYWNWTEIRRRTGQKRFATYLKDVDFDTIWDKREYIAKNFNNPHEDQCVSQFIKDYDETMYYVDVADIWQYLDVVLQDIIPWIGYTIDESRFDKWYVIYNKWRKMTMQRFRFHWYLNEIIDAIVTNKYINLMRFNLDLMQECVILHILMTKHNSNLLAEGLEYFTDTKQLHNLLTPYKGKQ